MNARGGSCCLGSESTHNAHARILVMLAGDESAVVEVPRCGLNHRIICRALVAMFQVASRQRPRRDAANPGPAKRPRLTTMRDLIGYGGETPNSRLADRRSAGDLSGRLVRRRSRAGFPKTPMGARHTRDTISP